MLVGWLLAVAGLSSVAAASECPAPTPVPELEERLAAARAAWVALDTETFRDAMDEVALIVPCLDAVPTPATAATLHRMTALRRHVSGGVEGAAASLRAARALGGPDALPDDEVPAGHELRLAWQALGDDTRTTPAPAPRAATAWFDGRASLARPRARATLFQLTDPSGAASLSRYLEPGAPLPDYPARPGARVGLAVATGVLAAIAGGLYGGAWGARRAFDATPSTDDDALVRLRATTNGLSASAAGVGGAALATGIAALAVRR